jgi:hypothetical protein
VDRGNGSRDVAVDHCHGSVDGHGHGSVDRDNGSRDVVVDRGNTISHKSSFD